MKVKSFFRTLLWLIIVVVVALFSAWFAVKYSHGDFQFSEILNPEKVEQNAPIRGLVRGQSVTSDGFTRAAQLGVQGVVNIEVQMRAQRLRGSGQPMGSLLDFFFGPQQNYQPQQGFQAQGAGSGVIISPDGYILTNNHVISGAQRIKVTLDSQQSYFAELVGTDPNTDLAVLRISTLDTLPHLVFGDSEALSVGEWVLAVGNPFGLNSTVTAGIVSAKGRSLGVGRNTRQGRMGIESFIQTDAAVNPGNSGGALINTSGQLVGINTLIKSPTGTFAGYSFAVPAIIAQKVATDIINHGEVQRALLGISMIDIDDQFIQQYGQKYGVNELGGVFVAQVTPGGPAHTAGLQVGDVITQIDDTQIDSAAALQALIATLPPNQIIKIFTKNTTPVKPFIVTLRNTISTQKI